MSVIPASIWEGEVRTSTFDDADRVWCAIVARGRIVAREHDGGERAYRVHLVLVESPELRAGEVWAIFFMGGSTPRCYRTTPADARTALASHGGFNLA